MRPVTYILVFMQLSLLVGLLVRLLHSSENVSAIDETCVISGILKSLPFAVCFGRDRDLTEKHSVHFGKILVKVVGHSPL